MVYVNQLNNKCWYARDGRLYTADLLGSEWSEPVELEGTTVSRASLHNISILRSLQLGIGDELQVYKANMIIPQIAENLTPETKEILRNAERKISKQNMRKLAAMMRPEQQKEAAGQLASGEIKSVDEYYRAHGMMTFEDGVAALKDLNRDRSYTPELFVEETLSNLSTIQKELDWLGMPHFQALYASVSQEQLDQLKSGVNTIHAILHNFINAVETAMRGNSEESEEQETAEISANEQEAS